MCYNSKQEFGGLTEETLIISTTTDCFPQIGHMNWLVEMLNAINYATSPNYVTDNLIGYESYFV